MSTSFLAGMITTSTSVPSTNPIAMTLQGFEPTASVTPPPLSSTSSNSSASLPPPAPIPPPNFQSGISSVSAPTVPPYFGLMSQSLMTSPPTTSRCISPTGSGGLPPSLSVIRPPPFPTTVNGSTTYTSGSVGTGYGSYDSTAALFGGAGGFGCTAGGAGAITSALPVQAGSTSAVLGGLMAAAVGAAESGTVGAYLSSFNASVSGSSTNTGVAGGGGSSIQASLTSGVGAGSRSSLCSATADMPLQPMMAYRRPFTTAKPPYSYISLITMAIQV